MSLFQGLGVAMVTPFKKDLTLDLHALKKLTEFLVTGGVDYLVVMGTTGETATLHAADKKAVLDMVLTTNANRKPVVLGMGGNHTIELCRQLDSMDTTGIAAVLSVTPYYNKPTQNGLYEHYKALNEHTKVPIILYNVPSRTGVNLLPDTVSRIASDCRNVIGIKEACGNMEQIMTTIRQTPKEFLVISGDDTIALPLMAAGADGIISVVGNAFPRAFADMIHHTMNNQWESARNIHYKLLEIIQLLFVEGNPAGIKEILSHLGICDHYLRLPLMPVSPLVSEQMRRVMINEGLFN